MFLKAAQLLGAAPGRCARVRGRRGRRSGRPARRLRPGRRRRSGRQCGRAGAGGGGPRRAGPRGAGSRSPGGGFPRTPGGDRLAHRAGRLRPRPRTPDGKPVRRGQRLSRRRGALDTPPPGSQCDLFIAGIYDRKRADLPYSEIEFLAPERGITRTSNWCRCRFLSGWRFPSKASRSISPARMAASCAGRSTCGAACCASMPCTKRPAGDAPPPHAALRLACRSAPVAAGSRVSREPLGRGRAGGVARGARSGDAASAPGAHRIRARAGFGARALQDARFGLRDLHRVAHRARAAVAAPDDLRVHQSRWAGPARGGARAPARRSTGRTSRRCSQRTRAVGRVLGEGGHPRAGPTGRRAGAALRQLSPAAAGGRRPARVDRRADAHRPRLRRTRVLGHGDFHAAVLPAHRAGFCAQSAAVPPPHARWRASARARARLSRRLLRLGVDRHGRRRDAHEDPAQEHGQGDSDLHGHPADARDGGHRLRGVALLGGDAATRSSLPARARRSSSRRRASGPAA